MTLVLSVSDIYKFSYIVTADEVSSLRCLILDFEESQIDWAGNRMTYPHKHNAVYILHGKRKPITTLAKKLERTKLALI
jgi:hypothetical protein